MMGSASRWLIRGLTTLTAAAALFLCFSLVEFLSATDETIKGHIQVLFEDRCVQNVLNKSDFEGPIIKNKDFWHYEFYWKNRSTQQIALGLVEFFPIRSEVWFLEPGARI